MQLARNSVILVALAALVLASPAFASGGGNAGADGAAAAILNGVGSLNQQEKQSDKEKEGTLEALAKAALLAASAAAMAAAAAGNKKRDNQIRAADPIQTPEIPGASPPPTPSDSPMQLPSPPATSTESEEEPTTLTDSNPIPMPTPTAEAPKQAPADSPAVAAAPASDIPDSIPDARTKLGYDESNPTGSGAAPQQTSYSASAGRGADSGAGAQGLNAGTPAAHQEKWAKNNTQPDPDAAAGTGGDGGGGAEAKAEGEGGGVMDMINSLMGKGGTELAGGVSMQGMDVVVAGYGKSGGAGRGERTENIFEHASWRYQRLATEDQVKKNGALHRKMRAKEMANVLSRAGEFLGASLTGSRVEP